MVRFFSLLMLVGFLSVPAWAVEPDEMLADPDLEARALEVSKELRCVVCQNNSIDDSNSELAKDMRILVRERILAGDSNQDILDFMVDRYGEFVLMTPRFHLKNALLWIGPALFVVIGGLIVFGFYRRNRQIAEVAAAPVAVSGLSDEEQRKFEALMKDE